MIHHDKKQKPIRGWYPGCDLLLADERKQWNWWYDDDLKPVIINFPLSPTNVQRLSRYNIIIHFVEFIYVQHWFQQQFTSSVHSVLF